MRALAILVPLLLTGCSRSPFDCPHGHTGLRPADLTAEQEVASWALLSSAASIWQATVAHPLAVIASVEGTDDPCPARSEGEGTYTLSGPGCRDARGRIWDGAVTVDPLGESDDTITLTFDEMRWVGTLDDCDCADCAYDARWSGEIRWTPSTGAFTAWPILDGETAAIGGALGCARFEEVLYGSYEGQVTPVDGSEATVYRGTGRVEAMGRGWLETTTDDQRVDPGACAHEPLAGTTTLDTARHTAVVTWDGASDCDPEATATWTLDGVERGEVQGVACATNGPPPAGWLPGLLLALLLRRRP